MVTVAAVQASPVFMDAAGCIDKCEALVAEAVANGAQIVVLPEAFVPTFPVWVWRTNALFYNEWFSMLQDQAVVVPGPRADALADIARAHDCWLGVGVNERDAHGATLYNTLLYFSPRGELMGRHRKLMPSGGERLVWGMGDGSTLDVVDTPAGRMGGLICWENYMPLARQAMYAKGVDLWLAPTYDGSDSWVASMRHIAKEGRCYVMGVAPFIRAGDVPADFPRRDELVRGEDDIFCHGHTVICDPRGSVLAGPAIDVEQILYAEVDPVHARSQRQDFDVAGHYGRPDVFRLLVNEAPGHAAEFHGGRADVSERS